MQVLLIYAICIPETIVSVFTKNCFQVHQNIKKYGFAFEQVHPPSRPDIIKDFCLLLDFDDLGSLGEKSNQIAVSRRPIGQVAIFRFLLVQHAKTCSENCLGSYFHPFRLDVSCLEEEVYF